MRSYLVDCQSNHSNKKRNKNGVLKFQQSFASSSFTSSPSCFYRLIYLRVAGMDDGLDVKERIYFVSLKILLL